MATTRKIEKKEKTMGSVVAHPLRARCLIRLSETIASPAELAHEFRRPLSDVSYHVAILLKAGAIELVGERPVRGSVEHFYRAIRLSNVTTEEADDLEPDERLGFARLIFQLAAADATVAFDAKTFGRRSDSVAMRFPLTLDEEGWAETKALFDRVEGELFEIRAKSDGRRAERGDVNGDGSGDHDSRDIRTAVFVTMFERGER